MYYNGYIPNRWQQVPQQNAYQQQLLQQQQQMMQQQFPQMPQSQVSILKGRLVSSIEEVKATPVDMDGSETYFPHPASNSIYTKSIGMDGNPIIHRYVLAQDDNSKEVNISDLDKRVKSLEEILESLTGGNKE